MTEKTAVNETACEDLGALSNGCHLYRKPNQVGGHVYFSDEVGGGVHVWDTALVDEGTLLAALCCEKNRRYFEYLDKEKSHMDLTPTMQMEQCAATGGSFLPKEVLLALDEPEDFDESISDWLKIRAIKCYLALQGRDNTHNITEKTAAQFDKCDYGWKRDWVRVARVSS